MAGRALAGGAESGPRAPVTLHGGYPVRTASRKLPMMAPATSLYMR